MLTILLFLFFVLFGTIIGFRGQITKKYDSFGGYILAMIAGIIMCMFLIAIPCKRRDCRVEILKFKSFEQTVKDQRTDTISYMERATLTLEIIKQNSWLAEAKYDYKNLWTNWYITEDVLTLNPIK